MGKITVELDDTLPDRCSAAVDDFRDLARTKMLENRDAWEVGDDGQTIADALDLQDMVHEIADGAVPIFTREIETAWYLHGSELEQAYADAGIGENVRENQGMAAIYCYIEQHIYNGFAEVIEEIRDEIAAKEAA